MMERMYATVRYEMSTGMHRLTLGKSCHAQEQLLTVDARSASFPEYHCLVPEWPSGGRIMVLWYCLQHSRAGADCLSLTFGEVATSLGRGFTL